MGEHVAYLRVSTTDQNTERQLSDTGFKFTKIFEDKCSGATASRPALEALIEYVREGDTVHVHSIDRLARNLNDLLQLLEQLTGNGVSVTFHKEKLTFNGENNPFQTLQLQVIGAVAQFERSMIKERQREGIAKAKEAGKYKGRKRSIKRDQVIAMKAEGLGPTAIANELGVSRMSIHRILNSG
ncbi:recombinase family protein [Aestuariispira insulae]|uniref:DNA invertase Pin-like site-specific DNA recombinase n=1 Tax=Aestuariispira insulae TaxID=1461337 RepID=A0A3D9HVD3_9PROT|nr:recombinase family protein [Aestuariispira insulae]RED53484.1 DNA invertase Pin-like site-specific DNA recombinase [Aestuariispira insulae]